MRLESVCAAALLAALAVPAAAAGDVMDVYSDLAQRRLTPAPLVPTVAPRALAPMDTTITTSSSRRRSGYALRLVHYSGDGPDAIIAFERGQAKTIKAHLREDRRFGFKLRRTRVRGHAGYVLTRRLGPTERWLLWSEGGQVYAIGSGTPKKVSLRDLRTVAAGLDRLERPYVGSGGDPDLGSGAVMVTTEHTVTGHLEWGAECVLPGGMPGTAHGGQAHFTLLPRQGNAFGIDIARQQVGSDAWTGSASGTVTPDVVTLNVRATATLDGSACDTGPLVLTLDQRPI